ncbi:MAG: MTAP family purine nucleoside phosphorylase [Planctomycetota bacterium]|jgi:5'-methylthioadenosine phosphorylase
MGTSKKLLGVIAGSEAHSLLEKGFDGEEIAVEPTPYGKPQPVFRITDGEAEFLVLCRHGTEGYAISAPFVNYRANIWALKSLGVTHIIAWSGPGAINPEYKVGSYVLPDDLLDETRNRAQTFFENTGLGFIRQNPVFCPTLSNVLESVLRDIGAQYGRGATYVVTEGPRLETPAEIRKFKSFGADLVGMTLAPEVFLAKELEIHYAAICYVTNAAEGGKSDFKPGVLFEGLASEKDKSAARAALERFPDIMRAVSAGLSGTEQTCACDMAMERYRKRGLVGEDFRTWIKR